MPFNLHSINGMGHVQETCPTISCSEKKKVLWLQEIFNVGVLEDKQIELKFLGGVANEF